MSALFLCTTALIFVINIIGVRSVCYWQSGDCHLQCVNMNRITIVSEIDSRLNDTEKVNCRNDGILLRIQSLLYPNGSTANTYESNWFTAEVKVNELMVHTTDIKFISVDAFNATAFQTVKKLSFPTLLTVDLIQKGIFNGLNELEVIIISSAKVKAIQKGILDSLKELKEFSIVTSGNQPEISVNGFTGSEPLQKLENVKITYNLSRSILSSTFNGLTNVKILDLSSCHIASIEANSFYPISDSIEKLYLRDNKLTTVPGDLFNLMLPKSELIIYIDKNVWHCDCELLPFRLTLEQYLYKFDGSIECNSPACGITQSIIESECFDECESPSSSTPTITTTSADTTTATSTTTPTTDSPANDYFTKLCYKSNEPNISETISIKSQSSSMTITESGNGEVNLNIENKQNISSMVIWLSENEVSVEGINCIIMNERTSIPINNLMKNVAYTFYLMEGNSTNVSPLDLISYTKRLDQIGPVWLFKSSKTLTITLIVAGLIFSVVFGTAIGFWMLNKSFFAKNDSQIVTISSKLNETVLTTEVALKDRMSNMTTFTDNTMLTRSQYDTTTYNIPPLPERQPNMKIFEEPVYATVDYIYNR